MIKLLEESGRVYLPATRMGSRYLVEIPADTARALRTAVAPPTMHGDFAGLERFIVWATDRGLYAGIEALELYDERGATVIRSANEAIYSYGDMTVDQILRKIRTGAPLVLTNADAVKLGFVRGDMVYIMTANYNHVFIPQHGREQLPAGFGAFSWEATNDLWARFTHELLTLADCTRT